MGRFTFSTKYDEPDVPWDENDPASVEKARRIFNSYIEANAQVFKVGPKGEMTEVSEFEPGSETLFVFYSGGGC